MGEPLYISWKLILPLQTYIKLFEVFFLGLQEGPCLLLAGTYYNRDQLAVSKQDSIGERVKEKMWNPDLCVSIENYH